MRVWVDLSNSPHVELFGPIVDHLAARGDDVVLTARDHAQTVQLARPRWPQLTVVGGPSPPGRAAKAAGIARRAGALARFAAGRRIDVAVSHGSYAQIAAACLISPPSHQRQMSFSSKGLSSFVKAFFPVLRSVRL